MADAYDIVDSHTHVFPTTAAAAAFRGPHGGELPAVGDLDDARSYMAERGVRKLVLLPLVFARRDFEARLAELEQQGEQPDEDRVKAEVGDAWTEYNLWAAGVARAEPDSFKACVAVDPVLLGADWARAEIERALDAGATAIKIMPAWIGCSPSDERMNVVWELADEHGLPVVSQSGLTNYSDVSHPDNFEPVAAAFPRVKVILAHMGLGAEDRTIALTAKHPNVFVDTSAWFNFLPDPDSWINVQRGTPPCTPDEVAELLRGIGIDRVLFGTNYAIRDPAAPHEWIRSIPLTELERQQIFSENYARVFGD
jgi:predicted TIM-barrel fold metal-dependent hydrolase